MTSKEAAKLLIEKIKHAADVWANHENFERDGGMIVMEGNKAKELLALIQAQEAELKQLREIFSKDVCADVPSLEQIKQQERERCAAIVLHWANRTPPARKQPLMNAMKQIVKGD